MELEKYEEFVNSDDGKKLSGAYKTKKQCSFPIILILLLYFLYI